MTPFFCIISYLHFQALAHLNQENMSSERPHLLHNLLFTLSSATCFIPANFIPTTSLINSSTCKPVSGACPCILLEFLHLFSTGFDKNLWIYLFIFFNREGSLSGLFGVCRKRSMSYVLSAIVCVCLEKDACINLAFLFIYYR